MAHMDDHNELSAVAAFLHRLIEASGKKQREIAREVGFDRPNMLSMLKHDECKVPLGKVPALAKALHVDPAHLFRLAMEQNWPDLHEVIRSVFGTVVTRNELAVIEALRTATGTNDPAFPPDRIAAAVNVLLPSEM